MPTTTRVTLTHSMIMNQLEQYYANNMWGSIDRVTWQVAAPVRTEAIIRGRQKGKTEKLLYLANKKQAIIVTDSRMNVRELQRKATEKGYTIPEPITYYQYESSPASFIGRAVLLENIEEYILSKFNDNSVLAFTMSVGEGSRLDEEEKDESA